MEAKFFDQMGRECSHPAWCERYDLHLVRLTDGDAAW